MNASVFPDAVPLVTTRLLAARRRLPGGQLVQVERLDADRVPYTRVELRRDGDGPRLAGGLLGSVGELLALEQRVGDRRRGGQVVEDTLRLPGCPARG